MNLHNQILFFVIEIKTNVIFYSIKYTFEIRMWFFGEICIFFQFERGIQSWNSKSDFNWGVLTGKQIKS